MNNGIFFVSVFFSLHACKFFDDSVIFLLFKYILFCCVCALLLHLIFSAMVLIDWQQQKNENETKRNVKTKRSYFILVYFPLFIHLFIFLFKFSAILSFAVNVHTHTSKMMILRVGFFCCCVYQNWTKKITESKRRKKHTHTKGTQK